MATTSSSDDSITAPKDFHLASSSLDSGSRLGSPPKQRCTLCGNYRRVFYCKDCIHNGLFYHSKREVTESYLDKKRTLLQLQDEKKTMEKKCSKLLENRQKADALVTRIRQTRERNKLIKLATDVKKQKTASYSEKLLQLEEEIKRNAKNLRLYEQSVNGMEDTAENKREKVQRLQQKLNEIRPRIEELVKMRIEELKQDIFPIEKLENDRSRILTSATASGNSSTAAPVAGAGNSSQEMDSSDAVIIAMHEVSSESFNSSISRELEYSIVAPTLPASGDYSLYNLWVAENKDHIPVNRGQNFVNNPAHNISGALTYTAQLVNILAFYLNVRLPYRLVFSDFCGSFMDEAQFNRRVSRLNANVMHLCVTQNCNVANLNISETLTNLLKLMDPSNPDLGHETPVSARRYQPKILYSPIARDPSGENTDSDEGDSFHREWETLPHIPCQEVPSIGPTLITASGTLSQQQQMVATQQQQSTAVSMAGGLVTSAATSLANIWRGWTGGPR